MPSTVFGTTAKLAGRCLRVAACLVTAIFLVACSSTAPKPVNVEGYIKANAVLNPDIRGQYKPVNLKLYFLKNRTKFDKGSFIDLFHRVDEYLARDLVHVESLQILPGQTLEFERQIPAGADFVGAVAAFRDANSPAWRSIVPIPEKCFTCFGAGLWQPVRIELHGSSVKLSFDQR